MVIGKFQRIQLDHMRDALEEGYEEVFMSRYESETDFMSLVGELAEKQIATSAVEESRKKEVAIKNIDLFILAVNIPWSKEIGGLAIMPPQEMSIRCYGAYYGAGFNIKKYFLDRQPFDRIPVIWFGNENLARSEVEAAEGGERFMLIDFSESERPRVGDKVNPADSKDFLDLVERLLDAPKR